MACRPGSARAAWYSGEKWLAHMTRAKPHQATGGEDRTASGRLRSRGRSSRRLVAGAAACRARVTGLASTSRGAATSTSSRCWTMWTEKRLAAPASIGDSSATATAPRPARNRAVRCQETTPGPRAARTRLAATSHATAAATSRLAMLPVHLQAPAGHATASAVRGAGGGPQRQGELEDAAGAGLAPDLHRAAVRLDDRLHDRQAEAGPAEMAAPPLVEPGETIEDATQAVGRHAGA